MKKLMLFSLLAISMVSCSKNDDVQPTTNGSDFKIEVALSGAIDDYAENISVNITNDEGVELHLLGYEWKQGDRTQTSPNSVTYIATSKPTIRTLTTSHKAKSLFLLQTMIPIKENPQPLTSTITLYQNGKVKTKKKHVFNGEINQYLLVD
ncbi:beta-barrel fold lipoprotein [Sphingobacterium composti Ten et al. 2007 non Yoo et al. 2007]|uniref:beta-barrel fold lipoprotein n=1 Tax=Sphingobacterium composti TaxID=363260 RepID=UPI00135747A3|nr:beta-barrel fold lipoprotein [Sphingobacterium composti Ten et al. 2007 non Yoo et al. 2007]